MISCTCYIQFCNTLESRFSKAEKFSNDTFRQKGHFLEVYLLIYFNTYSNWIHGYIIPHRGDKNRLPRVRRHESGAGAMRENILQRLPDRYLNYWQLCWIIGLKYTPTQFCLQMNEEPSLAKVWKQTEAKYANLYNLLSLEKEKRINLPFCHRPVRVP